jgi:hypothetical protein
MMKNDITYEYRVFTNRLIDVESMEIGKCTSKVVKELKPKDKVDGRFFHTSDTDEWFFCWNGELQKLNLKGDADVNAALSEVERLITEANAAVDSAKITAKEAKDAAESAKVAADNATAAVESIENKADKSDVEAVSKSVESVSQVIETKADKSELDSKADASDVKELSDKVSSINLEDYAKKSEIPSLDGYATEVFVTSQNYAKTSDIPSLDGYLTTDAADLRYVRIGSGSGSEGVDLSDYATKEYVSEEISKIVIPEIPEVPTKVSQLENDVNYLTEHQDISGKQDVIEDLNVIREGAAAGAVAEKNTKDYADEKFQVKGNYEVAGSAATALADAKSYTNDEIAKLNIPSMNEYYTKTEIDNMFTEISDIIGDANEYITNTILA